MCPGRKMCVVPHGTKTTKAVVEGLRRGCGVMLQEKVVETLKALCALIQIYFLSYNTNFEVVKFVVVT